MEQGNQIPQQQIAPDQQVNVFNPEGDLVSIPANQFQEAQNMGYRPAAPEEVHSFLNEQKYGTTPEIAKTFAEGAARAATFGGSTKLETMFGAKPEDISARRETNPIASTTGEMTGLVGSAFVPGAGEANILNAAGRGTAEALGLGGASTLSKIGSSAVRGAVETALFQAGDELSKNFAGDPNQTIGTAMADIGISGLLGGGIGGAFGVVSPLWKATSGSKLGQFLEAFQKRANGEPVHLPAEISTALDKAGMEVAPEIRAAISQDPELQRMYSQLQESTTRPGLEAQEGLNNFKKEAAENVVAALGKKIEEIPNMANVSAHEVGEGLKDDLSKELKKLAEPFKEFTAIKDKFKTVALDKPVIDAMTDDIASRAAQEGMMISPSSPQASKINTILKELPGLKTLEELRLYQSNLWGQTAGNPDLFRVAGMVNKVLRMNESELLERAVGEKAPQLADTLKRLRKDYGAHADLVETLNDRLHVGRYSGTESFINALKDMKPEDILNRLTKSNDAGMIDLLKNQFPALAEKVKEYQLNKLLSPASLKAPLDHAINVKVLGNALDKLSPEMRAFVLPAGAEEKIQATRALLEALPDKMNPSGTAKTLDTLWGKVPGGAMAALSMLTGHNPIAGYLIGAAGRWIGRDAPDAVRLGMLKFLGHSGPVDPPAFKAMVDYAVATMKGETKLNKAVSGMFKAGQVIFPQTQLPDDKKLKRIDDKIRELHVDNSKLLDMGGKTSYYLPDHGTAMAQTAMQAVNYLNSIRPSTDKPGILDSANEPSAVEKANYKNALVVAEQPLSVLQSVKEGTITPQDIVALKTIYPGLYEKMSNKIVSQMVDHVSKGELVPYKTRIGLSLFLAQPMDSTMTPQSIMMNQMAPQQSQAYAPQSQGPHSYKALDKLAAGSMNPDQSRLVRKGKV